MFKLSSIFRDINEEYLVIPVIRSFMKQVGIRFASDWDKDKMLMAIEDYANSSLEAEVKVQDWLDEVLREGIKELQIEFRTLKTEMSILFNSKEKIVSHLNVYLAQGIKRHVCGNNYSGKDYQFIKFDIEDTERGLVAIMYFCKKMHFAENKVGTLTVKIVDYPVIAEYYFERSWLCLRYKPRSGLYVYREEGYDLSSVRISMNSELKDIINQIENILGLESLTREQNATQIRRKLFILLDRYTHTPKEIVEAMDKEKESMAGIVNTFANICKLEKAALASVQEDVHNLVEKYFSIYWPDPSIFTQDRCAYPIHLSAQDEESSQVDQRAGLNKPLQSRAVFFDNKRMLYQQKSCESIQFFWKKLRDAGSDVSFPVKIYENKGRCLFKFSKYTAKEDIENVLFSIIDAQ